MEVTFVKKANVHPHCLHGSLRAFSLLLLTVLLLHYNHSRDPFINSKGKFNYRTSRFEESFKVQTESLITHEDRIQTE